MKGRGVKNKLSSSKKNLIVLMGMSDKKFWDKKSLSVFKKAELFKNKYTDLFNEVFYLSVTEIGYIKMKRTKHCLKNEFIKELFKTQLKLPLIKRYQIANNNCDLFKIAIQHLSRIILIKNHYIHLYCYYVFDLTMTKKLIESMIKILKKANDNCCLCLEPFITNCPSSKSCNLYNRFECDYESSNNQVIFLKCGHLIHYNCLYDMFMKSSSDITCPLCRNYDPNLYCNIWYTTEKYKKIFNRCLDRLLENTTQIH